MFLKGSVLAHNLPSNMKRLLPRDVWVYVYKHIEKYTAAPKPWIQLGSGDHNKLYTAKPCLWLLSMNATYSKEILVLSVWCFQVLHIVCVFLSVRHLWFWKSMPVWANEKSSRPFDLWNSRHQKCQVCETDVKERLRWIGEGREPVGWTHFNLNAAEVSVTQQLVCGYRTDWASTSLNCLCRERELLHSWAGQLEDLQ